MVTGKPTQWTFFRTLFHHRTWIVILILAAMFWGKPQALLAAESPSWWRIRTNSIPHQPETLTVDSTGSVWVTALENTEYDPGVWRLPNGDTSARFQYFTDSRANNYLRGNDSNLVEKPMLTGSVRYAVQDNDGNVWYALNNRKVLCEKTDGAWLTFAMNNSQTGISDTTGVDSAHRIRLMGNQGKMLISARSIKRITSGFTLAETRAARSEYNNDFIHDALIDSYGRYWIASGRGVEYGNSIFNTFFASQTDEYENDPEVPPYESPITGMEEDSLGNMWFINSAYGATGIYCLTAPTQDNIHGDWLKFDIQSLTGARNQVTCLAAGTDGIMWFGPMASGIVKYTPGAATPWTRFTCASLGLQSESLTRLKQAGGKLWFVTDYNPSVPGHGTGVHALTLADSSLASYTYRENSTSLTSNKITHMAGDLSGGVWFAADDDPSVSRMKSDGTWVQYRTDKMDLPWVPGTGSINGIGVDSHNIVYMAPNRRAPLAYDISEEQWLTLPDGPLADTYFYNVYVDPKDGKWFCGAEKVYHLNADNSAWTLYDTTDSTRFPDYRIEYALMDGEENMWFMTTFILNPAKVSLMKKDPDGGAPTWYVFTNGDASGYLGGPRLYLGNDGRVWNSASQRFDSKSNTWITQTDTTPFENRPMHFLNGDIPVNMSLAGALKPITQTDQDRMTVDRTGNVYFSSSLLGLSSVNAGIVVTRPVRGDTNRNGKIELDDAILSMGPLTGKTAGLQSTQVDVTGNSRVGMANPLYVIQVLSGLR